MRRIVCRVGLSVCLAAVPSLAAAQSPTTGAVAGIVRDSTGGVLPGVTVAASSPALIEKSRETVTDDQGNYKIVDLRPGTYSVTFTLAGFGTFRRDGLELNTGGTAAVNAELRVGSLEETVTVSGASPVVDVQNVRQQTVLTRTALDTLPTGKNIPAFAALIVGAKLSSATVQDVGGNQGENTANIVIHGGRANDTKLLLDGMNTNSLQGFGGGSKWIQTNQASVQEIAMSTGGASAESETGGIQLNVCQRRVGTR